MSQCNKCNRKTRKCNCKERCYSPFNYPSMVAGEKTLLTGIRHVNGECDDVVYVSGFYVPFEQPTTSFVYKGGLDARGTFYNLNYPSVNGMTTTTNLYGPDNGQDKDTIRVVGNFTYHDLALTFGCMYEGNLDGSGTWTTIIPPFGTIINTICHSIMGDLVVGNYDTNLVQGKAFIYNVQTHQYIDITRDGVASITAYGIWHNGNDHYTICGGLTNNAGTNAAYVVDFDYRRNEFYNWHIYFFKNDLDLARITHFDGITAGEHENTYNLTGMWDEVGVNVPRAFFVTIKRKCFKCNAKFSNKALWCPVFYPRKEVTTGNTVYKDNVLGVYKATIENPTVNGYVSRTFNPCNNQ